MMETNLLDGIAIWGKWPAIIIGACFFAAFVAVAADFFSGYAKAKRSGVPISSHDMRRTIPKAAMYLCMVLCGTAGDIISVFFWRAFSLPVLPYFTMATSLFVCFIEFRSVREKFSDKERARMADAEKQIAKLLAKIPQEKAAAIITTIAENAITNEQKRNEITTTNDCTHCSKHDATDSVCHDANLDACDQ